MLGKIRLVQIFCAEPIQEKAQLISLEGINEFKQSKENILLVSVFIVVTKHHHIKNFGEKRLYFILHLSVHPCYEGKSGKKREAGTWMQEVKQRSCSNAAYWLVVLYTLGPAAQRMAPPTVDWDISHQLSIKKMLCLMFGCVFASAPSVAGSSLSDDY